MICSYTYSDSSSLILNPPIHLKGYTSTDKPMTSDLYSDVEDENLTSFCMEVSESSLREVWDNEDDEYWASFLNKK